MSLARTALLFEADAAVRKADRTYQHDPTPQTRLGAAQAHTRVGDREGADDVRFGSEARRYTQASHKNLRAQDLVDKRRERAVETPEGSPARKSVRRAMDIEQKSTAPVGRSAREVMDRRREEIMTRTGGKQPKPGFKDKSTQFISRMLRRKDLPVGERGDRAHRRLLARNHGFRREGGEDGSESFTRINVGPDKNPTKGLMRSLRRGGHLATHDAKATFSQDPVPAYDPDDDLFGLGPRQQDARRHVKVTLTRKKLKGPRAQAKTARAIQKLKDRR